jgi:hypothetical protein
MAQSGRFGKYGDMKRKEKIRKTLLTRRGKAVKLQTGGREESRPGGGRSFQGDRK